MKLRVLAALAAALVTLTGCAMTGGDDSEASSTAKNVDSVTMKNDDVLVGELGLEEVRITTEYLSALTLETRHIERIDILSGGKAKIETRHGDTLHGKLDVASLKLKSKTGADVVLSLADVKRIRFKE